MSPIIVLLLSTVFLWLLIFVLYTQKLKVTLIPLYVLMGISIVVANYLVDQGFVISLFNLHFFVGSVTFFTTCLLTELLLYLLEGPRAARIGLFIAVGSATLYSIGIGVLSQEIFDPRVIPFGLEQIRGHIWSIIALILDMVFVAMLWEMLIKVKILPRVIRIFIVIYGAFMIDTFVFGAGFFYGKDIFWSVIQGNMITRFILAVIMTPMVEIFMKVGKHRERVGNKRIWEILNFKTDLERKISSLEEVIAEKNKAEKELKSKSEELEKANAKLVHLLEDIKIFKAATEAAADQIVFTDADGKVIYANKTMELLTGYKRMEVLGGKAGKLWGGLMSREFYEHMWETIKTKKHPYKGELINQRKDGEKYDASLTISPVLNDKEEVSNFIAIERDVTREKQLDRMKDEFLSIASHELRTPLTAIDGLVAMIRSGDYGEVNKNLEQPLEDINTSSERLISLVNDLLSVSRIEAGRQKYILIDMDICKEIDSVTNLLGVIIKKKNLKFEFKCEEKVIVQADIAKVQQVLNNMLGNSLKFTDKGMISVTIKKKAEQALILIKDTGFGIKPEDADKLFKKFQQLESGKGRPPGTGLGLYISKQLCKKMGGDLWLEESKLGEGSTFAFSLPLSASKAAEKAKKIIEKEGSNSLEQKNSLERND